MKFLCIAVLGLLACGPILAYEAGYHALEWGLVAPEQIDLDIAQRDRDMDRFDRDLERLETQIAQAPQWNAFAGLQVEAPPVEGKNRDKKRHDDFEPTPAPLPDRVPDDTVPPPDADVVDPDLGPPEHVEKRVKPRPQPGPGKHEEAEKGKDRHDTTIIDKTVYRTSWLPSAYDLIGFTWNLALTLVAFVLFRASGLKLNSLLTFWK